MFSDEETDLLRAIAPFLSEGARRALLIGEAQDPDGPYPPSLLVLSATGEVESSTPGVERWVSDLPGGNRDAGRLPEAVKSVAAQALRTAEGRDAPGEVALARVLAAYGLTEREREVTRLVLQGNSPRSFFATRQSVY